MCIRDSVKAELLDALDALLGAADAAAADATALAVPPPAWREVKWRPFEELAREPPSAARRAEMREIGRGVQRGIDLEAYEKGLMRAEMGEYSN